jgi:DeoR/GlpR family transcriptional regulator of sugar metabolism
MIELYIIQKRSLYMFAIERQKKIKEMLQRDKHVDVSELGKLFNVSEVTIRRDFDKLEQEGILIKTYGGAILREDSEESKPVAENDISPADDSSKRQIAKNAATMIDDANAIFLSPGSTCRYIAKLIKDKRLTVVTNDIMIALELKDSLSIRTVLLGGDLVTSNCTLVGSLTLRMLDGIYLNKAFIEVNGVDMDAGYTVEGYDQALLLQHVMKISKEVIVVSDYTRFDTVSFARLGALNMAGEMITNSQIPSRYKQYYFENDIKLLTTFEFE